MMTYRKLPRGEERISTLGLGMGGIQNTPPDEIESQRQSFFPYLRWLIKII